MRVTQRLVPVILAVGLASAITGAALADYLRREPPLGQLKPGQRVLVDDGTCPKGQIKEVVGGDHIKVGGKNRLERSRGCIAR